MRYSNIQIYVVVAEGKQLPESCIEREIGEGVNRGELPDGRKWTKDTFRTPQELRDLVHAEDAGDVEIKTAAEMRALMVVAEPKEIEP